MSAGWETVFPKGLMYVVSRHKQNSSLHQHIAASWKLLLGMFIIAALQLGSRYWPRPQSQCASQQRPGLLLLESQCASQQKPGALLLESLPKLPVHAMLPMHYWEPEPPRFKTQWTRECGTRITVRICFLSIIKRVNTSMTKDTESLYTYSYWRHCVQCLQSAF